MSRESRRLRFLVSGRVQGVGFRYFTARRAEQLGLCGWVRNRADGDVEGEIEGDSAVVDEFIAFLGEGPRWARVDSVDTEPLPVTGGADRFSIR